MRTYVDFDVIDIVNGGISYPTLPGIGWANDNLTVTNFKKHVMIFENRDIRFIAPMDPNEERWYVEPIKEEFIEDGTRRTASQKTTSILQLT